MKNILPISLFIILFSNFWLVGKLHLLPGVFKWLPDLFIGFIAIVVIARAIGNKSFAVPFRYLVIFLVFVYVVIAGALLNPISGDVIFAGIRTYFKYLPVFLLPLVFDYTEDDLKKQFKVILILGLLQIPVAFWQRFVTYRGMYTGDNITGSLISTNSLSMMMIATILVLIGFYLKRSLSFKFVALMALLLFLPTAINETKITPIFFLIGFVSLLYVARKYLSIKQVGVMLAGAVLLLGAFITLYDILYQKEGDVGFVGKMTDQERIMDKYNFRGFEPDSDAVFDIESKIVGEKKALPGSAELGRFDSIMVPLNVLAEKDITKLFIGLGIGNVTSDFGAGGYYGHIKEPLFASATTITQLLWETGIVGALVFSLLIVFIAFDCLYLSKENDVWANFATGWFGVTIMILASLPYNTLFHINDLMVIFMYFSGLIFHRRFVIKNNANHTMRNLELKRPIGGRL